VGDVGWIGWVGLGLAAWLAVAAPVGVLLGRVFRHRERQVPHDCCAVAVPLPRTGAAPDVPRPGGR
jgi:hypothetical protein